MEEVMNFCFGRLLGITFLTGIIFVVTALITLRFPPKKINALYGYRTPSSMSNQQVWDFAQRYSGIKMLQGGLALVLVSFTNLILNLNERAQISIGLLLIILSCIYLFVTTERAIKKNFPKE